VLEMRECEECGTAIGPDDAYVEIDIAADNLAMPQRSVRIHWNQECPARFGLKHPVPFFDAFNVKRGVMKKRGK
jgi:hypothetical protein